MDLRSAYYQLSLKGEDNPYTAFEARNNLCQFKRLPFGVTNGVACFQREMTKFVEEKTLRVLFPFLNNITNCERNQGEHDAKLKIFLAAAKTKINIATMMPRASSQPVASLSSDM